MSTRWILFLGLAVLLVIFTLQNQGKVAVKLFFWNLEGIPLALLMVICLLLGYLIPFFSLLSRIWKLKKELKHTREENEELQEERRESGHFPAVKPDPEGIEMDEPEEERPPEVPRRTLADRFFKD